MEYQETLLTPEDKLREQGLWIKQVDKDSLTDWYLEAQAKKTAEVYQKEYDRLATLTYCVYCGATFPLDNEAGAKVTNHIQACEKHPLNIERAEHQKEIEKLFILLGDLESLGLPVDCFTQLVKLKKKYGVK